MSWISCLGSLLVTYLLPLGVIYQNLCNMVSLHFLFNWKMDPYVFPSDKAVKVDSGKETKYQLPSEQKNSSEHRRISEHRRLSEHRHIFVQKK
jgi:hypothetical protein